FRGQLNLLTLGRSLHAAAKTSAGRCSDACTLSATGNASDDGADGCAGTYFFSSVLAARTSLALVLVGLDRVGLAADGNTIELQHHQRLSGKFAGTLQVDDVAFHVVAGRNGYLAVDGKR